MTEPENQDLHAELRALRAAVAQLRQEVAILKVLGDAERGEAERKLKRMAQRLGNWVGETARS